ncbi:RNA polymerase, sigma 28 subunit, FliA/WhiG [Desulfotomaculum nigrificans CO-1-SRB]|uniref:RNA polymerase, sigma 28 subunit, FliA/WhiG n=1 Tax=Desulfotomaculum nigrificans (strain DSM 14880 / VKM B-2319 / CO-1-SRB) TaxID=868595 RepID=F6B7Y8_DESCC|nr:FliA/WhiG family RNA polymerase sigma factor [Desulfotomaculum nigrificans]AEF94625.1 RNA polymerase, sigma 28 subunit, FliA/WhiG [Desulfotomaculum nigrificans CO-1-SRB]
MSIEELWDTYITSRDERARQQLILHYLPLVKHLAGRLAVKLPSFIQREDLEGYGVIGLMEALDKFDHTMGNSFDAYAYHRIRGAILDQVRRQNWLPRTAWQKLQHLKQTRERLERELGGAVPDEILAREMGISVDELNHLASSAGKMYLMSLDEEVPGSDGSVVRKLDLVEDTGSPDPLSIVEEKENRKLLARAIEKLGQRDQLILSLYYTEGLTLKEIGQVLEVSESRVCQLHGQVMRKLRKTLQEMLNS